MGYASKSSTFLYSLFSLCTGNSTDHSRSSYTPLKMRCLSITTSALAVLTALVLISAPATASYLPQHHEASKLTTTYQFSNTTWIENIATRYSGHFLVNLLDRPELRLIDPFAHPATSALVHGFSPLLGLFCIAGPTPDVFAVAAGNYFVKTSSPTTGSFSVWSSFLTRIRASMLSCLMVRL